MAAKELRVDPLALHLGSTHDFKFSFVLVSRLAVVGPAGRCRFRIALRRRNGQPHTTWRRRSLSGRSPLTALGSVGKKRPRSHKPQRSTTVNELPP
jgi:hypothetical protein